MAGGGVVAAGGARSGRGGRRAHGAERVRAARAAGLAGSYGAVLTEIDGCQFQGICDVYQCVVELSTGVR
jgi:hypothetical protein